MAPLTERRRRTSWRVWILESHRDTAGGAGIWTARETKAGPCNNGNGSLRYHQSGAVIYHGELHPLQPNGIYGRVICDSSLPIQI